MATTKNTRRNGRGLNNPAAVAVASSPAGQKAISSSIEARTEVAKQAASVIPFVLKTLVVVGIGYYAFGAWRKRFKSIGFNTSLPPANITEGQAQTRANALYSAMYGIGANFNTVQTNLAGLNYNGWVRVYNAFGKRKTANPFTSPMDLVEWIHSEFSGTRLEQLRFVLPGVF